MSETPAERFIRDEEILEEFWNSGATTGSIRRDCRHGITFYENDESAGDWEEGELEKLRADPNAAPVDRSASFSEMFGYEWCWHCQRCRAEMLRYQNILWNYRYSISNFLNSRLKNVAKSASEEKDHLTVKI